MYRLKLKAGALQFTTFIIVVIALLLTAFILLVHTHKQLQIQSDFIVEVIKLSDGGIDYTFRNSIQLNDTTTVNINDEDYKSLKVNREFWGVFEKVVSTATIKNKRFQKVALIGSKQSESNKTALYIQNNNKPLVLVGNTKIEGVAYLPKQGVKPGYISGQSYYGSKLIYGPTRVSSRLPKPSSEIISQIDALENITSKISQNQFLSIEEGEQHNNSYLKPIQVIFSNSVIDIRAINLLGHILIKSKSKIVIHSSSNLKDVVLVAPEIEIMDNVTGNFQAIASKKIIVGNNVQLNYPSALVVNEKKEVTQQVTNNPIDEQNGITISDNSIIKGLVMYIGQESPNNYKVQLELKDNATIYGELYCNQNTELKGAVYGTVYANNFIANQAGSVYQNHIYNGTINVNELPQEYVGLSFSNSKKEVLKWLY